MSGSRYADVWDRYVTEAWPRIRQGGRRRKEDLEEWRVLNTTDSSFEWPGDEWGDRELTERLFDSALADQLEAEPRVLCEIGSGSGRYTVLALERFKQARVLSFDVSRELEQALRRRCAPRIDEGRLETVLLGSDSRTMLDAVEDRGLGGEVDAVYSFDAMVHVDLHTLIVYFVTAARVLREGGVLAMNVADADSDKGFLKLLFDAPGVYSQHGQAGGHFMWISARIVHSVLTRLGFSVRFHQGNGRDAWFSAKLVDRSRSARCLERAGASW